MSKVPKSHVNIIIMLGFQVVVTHPSLLRQVSIVAVGCHHGDVLASGINNPTRNQKHSMSNTTRQCQKTIQNDLTHLGLDSLVGIFRETLPLDGD